MSEHIYQRSFVVTGDKLNGLFEGLNWHKNQGKIFASHIFQEQNGVYRVVVEMHFGLSWVFDDIEKYCQGERERAY